MIDALITLAVFVVLNVAVYFPMRWLGRRQVRARKLLQLTEAAREWQEGNYLTPVSFYWHGSNPVLLWRRQSDGKEFPLEIE